MYTSSSPTLTKRKLEDYCSTDEVNEAGDQPINPATRMRKDENTPAPTAPVPAPDPTAPTPTRAIAPAPAPKPHPDDHHQSGRHLQLFVRTLMNNKTLVVFADPSDTVRSLHEMIQSITKISVIEQGLIYKGRQLQWERTLIESGVGDEANLSLIGRMRSTRHPQACQLLEDLFHLCRTTANPEKCFLFDNTYYNRLRGIKNVKSMLEEYFSMMPRLDFDQAVGYLQVFSQSSATIGLVMLYMSPVKRNRDMADEAIKYFVGAGKIELPKQSYSYFAPLVLEFCKLLRARVGVDDSLYDFCRSNLGVMLCECAEFRWERKGTFWVKEIFSFVSELATKISHDLSLVGPSMGEVKDLTSFLVPLRREIEASAVLLKCGPIRIPICNELVSRFPVCYTEEITALHKIFMDLLCKMDDCMKRLEDHVNEKSKPEALVFGFGWNQYLLILKELYEISKLFHDGDKLFNEVMKSRRSAWNYLVVSRAKRSDDNKWILQFRELTNFETRRHLAMMMLPEMKDEFEELHEMLIDRSQLLSESFEYIARAEPESLRSGLFMEFKNEEATGPGVLREWFFLVCQAIFNPQNALFVACPSDRRRFYPNPASKLDPLHLDYFKFSGRVIALALVHKIQVGIVFDHVFFKQLAGNKITLEDIRDADPYLYNSCKQILEMDPEAVDQDALGLTFVHEVEELGTRRVIELRPGGKNIVVNSNNRKEYVDVLINHCFVVSIAEQVAYFAQGFADIANTRQLQKSFFQCLNPEDLDMMLHGSEKPISVDDWKAHTEYNGFKQSDIQISWFWKVVKNMSPEQRMVLLFFWTSLKFLPVEGFKGLASRLYIYRSSESSTHLPSSHTCFYRLCLPSYPSLACMRERLGVITQEHVGCSFGTW